MMLTVWINMINRIAGNNLYEMRQQAWSKTEANWKQIGANQEALRRKLEAISSM